LGGKRNMPPGPCPLLRFLRHGDYILQSDVGLVRCIAKCLRCCGIFYICTAKSPYQLKTLRGHYSLGLAYIMQPAGLYLNINVGLRGHCLPAEESWHDTLTDATYIWWPGDKIRSWCSKCGSVAEVLRRTPVDWVLCSMTQWKIHLWYYRYTGLSSWT